MHYRLELKMIVSRMVTALVLYWIGRPDIFVCSFFARDLLWGRRCCQSSAPRSISSNWLPSHKKLMGSTIDVGIARTTAVDKQLSDVMTVDLFDSISDKYDEEFARYRLVRDFLDGNFLYLLSTFTISK